MQFNTRFVHPKGLVLQDRAPMSYGAMTRPVKQGPSWQKYKGANYFEHVPVFQCKCNASNSSILQRRSAYSQQVACINWFLSKYRRHYGVHPSRKRQKALALPGHC